MKATDQPIIVEEFFDVSAEILWKALTELKQMKQWFFENIEAFEPRVGFKTRFVVENEGRVFPHLWKITEAEPLKKITYNWHYEGYKGNSFLTFEIIAHHKKTVLNVTHTVTEDFPQDIPEFKRERCGAGWNYFIQQRLKEYLKA
jgi:uncharacterized protein YndB with AHSA1/START domain